MSDKCNLCGNSGVVSPFQKCICQYAPSSLAAPAGSGAPACDVELAIALSRYVHDNCDNVPHDIGIHLMRIVESHQKPNDKILP